MHIRGRGRAPGAVRRNECGSCCLWVGCCHRGNGTLVVVVPQGQCFVSLMWFPRVGFASCKARHRRVQQHQQQLPQSCAAKLLSVTKTRACVGMLSGPALSILRAHKRVCVSHGDCHVPLSLPVRVSQAMCNGSRCEMMYVWMDQMSSPDWSTNCSSSALVARKLQLRTAMPSLLCIHV